MTKLKAIKALNEYVAVMKVVEVPEGIEVDQEALNDASNEGIVVGLGPDAVNKGVELGDKVIYRPIKYVGMQSVSGGYEGKMIVLPKIQDLLVSRGPSKEFEIEA